jgi:hypothetical protein
VRAVALSAAAAAATAAIMLGACGAGAGHRNPGQRESGRRDTGQQIPAALAREARPIGRGARFHPPAGGPVLGACRRGLGRRDAVHVELFAANRVMLVASGIGTRPPRRLEEGRIAAAGCYGALVTLEPTGVVLIRRGSRLTVADLFRSWGQPLGRQRMASFSAHEVTAFVEGGRWAGPVGRIALRRHAEIVLEVGSHVPPHARYLFPPADQSR